ncbi:MAG: trypsin-like peptidase domain-containing protein, partial [Acidobacteria bacterium]|nr:trypsin-like peptidase domain-containing protein [Acidobacteriota bacterium]
MIDINVLEETEERYAERKAPRETTQRKIETRPLSEVDTPERVEQRMERLGFGAEMARSVSVGELVTATLDEPSGVTNVEAVALERVLGRSDLLSANYFRRGLAVASAVGRIRIRNDRGRVVGFGTGFMVSPRLVLTNNHVLRSHQDASFSQVEFNFQDDEQGRPLPTFVFDLDPNTFFITDAALDFSIVAVRNGALPRPLKSFGFCKLIEAEGKILLGEYASIIQHPNGEAKQLALRENQVIDLLDNFMHYKTDTAPGSSGSAVFNDQWEVVALHHSGVPKRDAQKRVLATDGKVWTEDMGEQRIAWIANEGVRISRVIKRIKAQNLASAQRILRNEIFEAEPPRFVPGSETTVEPSPALRAAAAAPSDAASFSRSPVLGRDGSVSWTIPLTVSFQVGTPFDAPVLSASAADAGPSITSPASVTDAGAAPA